MIPIATPQYDAMSACAGFPQDNHQRNSQKVQAQRWSRNSPKMEAQSGAETVPKRKPKSRYCHSHSARAIPRGSDSSSSSSSGGPPGPPGGGPNGSSSQGGSSPHAQKGWQSIGIGSADVITEESVYRQV